jgi:hypothetical protein
MVPYPKFNTHVCVYWFDNHAYFPNIVGPWLPHQDGEENSKPYYFAAMLTFLNPWRKLENSKNYHKSWEENFASFIANAS